MKNDDLQKLKAAALAATPGPWEYREAEGMGAICHAGGWVMDDLSEQALRDTEYCATANPSAILALIAEVEQARAASDDRQALKNAAAALQQFKWDWMAVPSFAHRVNKHTRDAISRAIGPLVNLDAVGGPLDL